MGISEFGDRRADRVVGDGTNRGEVPSAVHELHQRLMQRLEQSPVEGANAGVGESITEEQLAANALQGVNPKHA